ncbi:hypothetical protein ISCGN_016459 [Ixodes scapularis]
MRWLRTVLLRWRGLFSNRGDLGGVPDFLDVAHSSIFREVLRFLSEVRHGDHSLLILKFSYSSCDAYSSSQEHLNVGFQNSFAASSCIGYDGERLPTVPRPISMPVERVMNETPELSTNNGETTGVNVPTSNSFECLGGDNPDGEPNVGGAAPTSHDPPGERRPCGVAPAEFLTQDGYTLVTYRSERKLKKPTDRIDKLYTVLFHPSLESRPFEATQRSKISKEIRSAFSKTAVTNIRLNTSKNILAVDTPYIETRDRLLLIRNLVRIPVRSFPATPTNASVGTVHGMAGEHSLQVIRTQVEAKGTILDIAPTLLLWQPTPSSLGFRSPQMIAAVSQFPSGARCCASSCLLGSSEKGCGTSAVHVRSLGEFRGAIQAEIRAALTSLIPRIVAELKSMIITTIPGLHAPTLDTEG